MKRFNVDAARQATRDARLSVANDLVLRTLAQHGLMPEAGQNGALPMSSLPSLYEMRAQSSGSENSADAPFGVVPAGAEFRTDTFECSASSRSYHTYVPVSAKQGVTGVIVMLHGCTQTPEELAEDTGMNALAEIHGLVVVYPKQARGDNAQSCWNWFNRGDQQRDRGEPAIIAGIAAEVCEKHSIKRDGTYVAGLSAGAAMAVILGETYGDVFAAIGAHSGLPTGVANDVMSAFSAMGGNGSEPDPQPQTPGTMRTIVFHGTADTTVHPSNGEAIAQRAIDANAAQSTEVSLTAEASGRQFTRIVSSDPDGKAIVEQWVIDGLGHAWSGGQSGGTYSDPKGPDASAEMIRFFLNTPDREV